jgi:uncharacterized membrane protein YjjB (DUF3815 family)
MSDHHAAASEGARASNWLWALVAAVVTAAVGTWLTGMALQGALLLAATVFGVYAVVLAQFWQEPPHGEAHDHADHGH